MPMPFQPWRAALLPASFAGAQFHVETGGISTGRRIAQHEYSKKNTPSGEDMGRKSRRWPITGYCIGPLYIKDRDALIAACEAEGPFTLVHPSLGEMQVNCETCNMTESREKGGYCTFEMLFEEAGEDPGTSSTDDTQAQVGSASDAANAAAESSLDDGLASQGGIGSDAVAGSRLTQSLTTLGASDIPSSSSFG